MTRSQAKVSGRGWMFPPLHQLAVAVALGVVLCGVKAAAEDVINVDHVSLLPPKAFLSPRFLDMYAWVIQGTIAELWCGVLSLEVFHLASLVSTVPDRCSETVDGNLFLVLRGNSWNGATLSYQPFLGNIYMPS